MADRVWTISNGISVARVFFLIPLAYCLFGDFESHRLWAGGVIVAGTITDFLDGYLARRFHHVSELGKIVDPLADKIAVGALGIFLVVLGDIPLWYLVVVLTRDVLILVGGMYIKMKKNIVAQSNWPGKVAVNAIALYLFLSTLLMEPLEGFRVFVLWSSVGMMVWSVIVYAQRLFIGRVIREVE